MTDKAINPLRRRMIEDMTIRKFAPKTQASYIVPGGGLSPDGERWIACRPGFFLPVRVLSRLFRRLFLEQLAAAHDAGHLHFFAAHAPLAERHAFAAYLAPLRKAEWVVHVKRLFAGPAAVLAYLSRSTHRVASPTAALSPSTPTASPSNGRTTAPRDKRHKIMTLASDEFIRRFLIHVLPSGFHRIRHHGLFANGQRAANLARARKLLGAPATQSEPGDASSDEPPVLSHPCPCCGGRMIIIETFERGSTPHTRPSTPISIDTS